jgi:hypothetical protein
MTDAEVLSTILSFISVLILLVTAVFVWLQVREMRQATYATAFKSVYDIIQADDVRDARRIVLTTLADKPVESWTDKETKAADKVCASYDCVGIMVHQRMLPIGLVADSWGDSLRRTWRILSPLVMRYRAERNSYEFWNDFEWLAQQAEKYRKAVYSQE